MADGVLGVGEDGVEVASFGLDEFALDAVAKTHVAEGLEVVGLAFCGDHVEFYGTIVVLVELELFCLLEILFGCFWVDSF